MKTFETEKHNIPEGATHYMNQTSYTYFAWGKFVGEKLHLMLASESEWTSVSAGMFDGLKPIPQTKEVEWVNGLLPPIGAKCVYFVSNQKDYPVDNHLREMTCVAHVGGFDGFVDNGLAVLVSSDYSFSTVCNESWIRKPETPEQKLERE